METSKGFQREHDFTDLFDDPVLKLPPRERYTARKLQFAHTVARYHSEVDSETFATLAYTPYEDAFLQPLCTAVELNIEEYLETRKALFADSLSTTILSAEEFKAETLRELAGGISSIEEDPQRQMLWTHLQELKQGKHFSPADAYYYMMQETIWGNVIEDKDNGRLVDHVEYSRLFEGENGGPQSEQWYAEAAHTLMWFANDFNYFVNSHASAIADFRFYHWLNKQPTDRLPQSLKSHLSGEAPLGTLRLQLSRDELGFYLRWWLEVFTEGENQTKVATAFGKMLGLSVEKLRQAISSTELDEQQKQRVRDLVQKHLDLLH